MLKTMESYLEGNGLTELVKIGNGTNNTLFYKLDSIRLYNVALKSLISGGLVRKINQDKKYCYYRLTKKGKQKYKKLSVFYQHLKVLVFLEFFSQRKRDNCFAIVCHLKVAVLSFSLYNKLAKVFRENAV